MVRRDPVFFTENDICDVIVEDAEKVAIAVTDEDNDIDGDNDSADEIVANDVIDVVIVLQLVADAVSEARPLADGLNVLVIERRGERDVDAVAVSVTDVEELLDVDAVPVWLAEFVIPLAVPLTEGVPDADSEPALKKVPDPVEETVPTDGVKAALNESFILLVKIDE